MNDDAFRKGTSALAAASLPLDSDGARCRDRAGRGSAEWRALAPAEASASLLAIAAT
jgi:hypothetical protein